MLNFVINDVGACTKRDNEFQSAQQNEIEFMVETGELDTSTWAIQIGILQSARDTRIHDGVQFILLSLV